MRYFQEHGGVIGAALNLILMLINTSIMYLYPNQIFFWVIMLIAQVIIGYLVGKHLAFLSKHVARDFLTGLVNKRYFNTQLSREILLAKRYGCPFTLFFLDIDDFKEINDTYGHMIGDKVLEIFSNILKRNIRNDDTLSRWGGDEFAIILPKTSMIEAQAFITRIHQSLQEPVANLKIRVSIGHATFDPQNPINPEELIKQADQVLYKIKELHKHPPTKTFQKQFVLVKSI